MHTRVHANTHTHTTVRRHSDYALPCSLRTVVAPLEFIIYYSSFYHLLPVRRRLVYSLPCSLRTVVAPLEFIIVSPTLAQREKCYKKLIRIPGTRLPKCQLRHWLKHNSNTDNSIYNVFYPRDGIMIRSDDVACTRIATVRRRFLFRESFKRFSGHLIGRTKPFSCRRVSDPSSFCHHVLRTSSSFAFLYCETAQRRFAIIYAI